MTNMTNPITKQVLYVLCISVCITEIALLIVPLTASPATSANFSQYGWLSVGGTLGILVALYLGGIVKNLNKQIPFFQKLKYIFYKSIPGFMVLMPVVLLSYMHLKYNELLIKNPDAISTPVQSLTIFPLIGQTIAFFGLMVVDMGIYNIDLVRKALLDTNLTLFLVINFISSMFFSVMQYYSVTRLATDGFAS